jgi:ABC-type transport system involved in multi-copper enzyme maturation permease subunit
MNFLPIVQHELSVAARRRSTFITRLLSSGVALLGAVFYILLNPMGGTSTTLGATTFRTLSYFAVALCCLIPLIIAHDCISEERKMGTIGLLLLTNLKGYDIVLGKLFGISLNAFYCLLGVLPTLALPILFGGIEPGEFWRMCLALANLMFFCFALAVTVSTFCTSSRVAFTMTAVAMFIFCGVLPALQGVGAAISPVDAFMRVFETQYLSDPSAFWVGLIFSNFTAFLLLAFASHYLPQSVGREQTRKGRVRSAPKVRDRMLLQIDPVQWLMRDSTWTVSVWVLSSLIIVGLVVASALPETHPLSGFIAWPLIAALVFFKLFFAQQSSRFFVDARRTGALEALCSTPLRTDQIIDGQWRALRKVFLLPSILLLVVYLVALQTPAFSPLLGLQSRTSCVGYNVPLLSIYLVALFAFDLVAIGWFSMWLGFSLPKPQFAVVLTILWAVVVPAIVIIFPHPLITLTLLVIGRSRLRQQFRNGNYIPGQSH